MITPERLERLIAKEKLEPLRTYYLSFSKPKSEGGWQGGIFVHAHGLVTAIERVNKLGINPGGEVLGGPHDPVKPELMDRLLSFQQMEESFGELQHLKTSNHHGPVCCMDCNCGSHRKDSN